MPVSRRSCERCRERKLKCTSREDDVACTNCRSKNVLCVTPPPTAIRQRRAKSDELDKRIQHLEGLVVDLTGSLARSGQSHHHDSDSRIQEQAPALIAPATADEQADAVGVERTQDARELPPPREGYVLLNEFLHDFNSKIPLFNPETIHNHVQHCYSGDQNCPRLSWMLTYVVFGIGHRLRVMSLFTKPGDISLPDQYRDKCLVALPELLLQEPTLRLVQALLGISILFQTSDRSDRAAIFVSTALRMVQDLGYNDVTQLPSEASATAREAQYVFWIAFHTDTDMSLSAMRPNTQRLADISTPLPDGNAEDWWTSSTSNAPGDHWKVNIFALHTQLALIQAEALEELFSVHARRHSPTSIAVIYSDVLRKVEEWRRQGVFAASTPQEMSKSMYRIDLVHLVILEAVYFRTLYQLHAANALAAFTYRIDVFKADALRQMAQLGVSSVMVRDARRLLALSAVTPQGNFPSTWASLRGIIAAICTVLAQHSPARSSTSYSDDEKAEDLRLSASALTPLELAAGQAPDSAYTLAIDVCRELYLNATESCLDRRSRLGAFNPVQDQTLHNTTTTSFSINAQRASS